MTSSPPRTKSQRVPSSPPWTRPQQLGHPLPGRPNASPHLTSAHTSHPDYKAATVYPTFSVNDGGPLVRRRRAKRTEQERINYLTSDPYVSQFEPYRVLCAICDKWIRLRPNSTYCSIPWDAHRKSCLARRGAHSSSSLHPSRKFSPDLSSINASNSAVSRSTGGYTYAELQNILSQDREVRKFDLERVLCRKCDRWIAITPHDHLAAVQIWLDHRAKCAGFAITNSPDSRMIMAPPFLPAERSGTIPSSPIASTSNTKPSTNNPASINVSSPSSTSTSSPSQFPDGPIVSQPSKWLSSSPQHVTSLNATSKRTEILSPLHLPNLVSSRQPYFSSPAGQNGQQRHPRHQVMPFSRAEGFSLEPNRSHVEMRSPPPGDHDGNNTKQPPTAIASHPNQTDKYTHPRQGHLDRSLLDLRQNEQQLQHQEGEQPQSPIRLKSAIRPLGGTGVLPSHLPFRSLLADSTSVRSSPPSTSSATPSSPPSLTSPPYPLLDAHSQAVVPRLPLPPLLRLSPSTERAPSPSLSSPSLTPSASPSTSINSRSSSPSLSHTADARIVMSAAATLSSPSTALRTPRSMQQPMGTGPLPSIRQTLSSPLSSAATILPPKEHGSPQLGGGSDRSSSSPFLNMQYTSVNIHAPPLLPMHDSRRRNAEQRAAALRSDELISHVEPNRVFCSLCQKWVQLRQDSTYCAYPWLQHRGKCVARHKRRAEKAAQVAQARAQKEQSRNFHGSPFVVHATPPLSTTALPAHPPATYYSGVGAKRARGGSVDTDYSLKRARLESVSEDSGGVSVEAKLAKARREIEKLVQYERDLMAETGEMADDDVNETSRDDTSNSERPRRPPVRRVLTPPPSLSLSATTLGTQTRTSSMRRFSSASTYTRSTTHHDEESGYRLHPFRFSSPSHCDGGVTPVKRKISSASAPTLNNVKSDAEEDDSVTGPSSRVQEEVVDTDMKLDRRSISRSGGSEEDASVGREEKNDSNITTLRCNGGGRPRSCSRSHSSVIPCEERDRRVDDPCALSLYCDRGSRSPMLVDDPRPIPSNSTSTSSMSSHSPPWHSSPPASLRRVIPSGLADLDTDNGRQAFIWSSICHLFATTYEPTDDLSISALHNYLGAALPQDKFEDFDVAEVVRGLASLRDRGKIALVEDIVKLL